MDRKFIINFHRKNITCLCDLEYLHGTKAIIEIAQGKEIQDSVGFWILDSGFVVTGTWFRDSNR